MNQIQSNTGRVPAALRRRGQTAIRIFRFGSRSASIPRPLAAGSVDFDSMSLDEAKRYFLEHRDEQKAFEIYMDKLHQSGRAIIIDPTDPDSEAKAQAAIQQKLSSHPQQTKALCTYAKNP